MVDMYHMGSNAYKDTEAASDIAAAGIIRKYNVFRDNDTGNNIIHMKCISYYLDNRKNFVYLIKTIMAEEKYILTHREDDVTALGLTCLAGDCQNHPTASI